MAEVLIPARRAAVFGESFDAFREFQSNISKGFCSIGVSVARRRSLPILRIGSAFIVKYDSRQEFKRHLRSVCERTLIFEANRCDFND